MDCWNPKKFDNELQDLLVSYSALITKHFHEENCLIDEYLIRVPHKSLEASQYTTNYSTLLENIMTPVFTDRSIRIWHYTLKLVRRRIVY